MPSQQLWGDDLFTDGATTNYGTHPNLYVGIRPFPAGAEGDTGYSMTVANGELYDGYQRDAGVSSGLAGFATTTSIGDFSSWCVERTTITDDVQVAMTPAMVTFSGTPDHDTFRQFGVCSHVTGGSLTQPGGDSDFEYWADVSGYFLIEAKQPSLNHSVFLLQVDAGVITVVDEEFVSITDPAHVNPTQGTFFRPTRLRMTVDSTGGNALIECFRTTDAGVEVRLFDTTFNLSVALADGRCGFGCQTRRTSTFGHDGAGVASVFSIRSSDGSTHHFTDRFQRLQPRAAAARTDTIITGHSLMSRWTGDGKGRITVLLDGSQYLVRGAAADQMETGATLSSAIDWPGYYLRQDPAKSSEQRVAANIIRLNVDTSTRSESGVLVRFTPQAFASGECDIRARFTAGSNFYASYYKRGYAVFVQHDEGATPVWELQIRHYNGSTSEAYRGDLLSTADLTSAGLIVGTAYELDVEIRNFDGDVFGHGAFVAIIAKINTTTITPVPEDIPGGGVVESDDFLVDTRSAATGDIGGMGLFFNPNARGTADMAAFLDFSEKTLTAPPRTDPDEQASVAIAAETAGSSGSLTIALDAVIGESSRSVPIFHRFESGKVQPIRMQPQSRTTYDVAVVMENAEWQALEALISSNGSSVPFAWTHPYTDEAHTVMFVRDSLSFEEQHAQDGLVVYAVSFQLEQLFAQATFNPQL